MQLVNYIIKGLVGAVIGAVTLAVLTVPLDIVVIGINPREGIGVWIGRLAFMLGCIVGWVLFSKEKWWKIVAMVIFTFLIMLVVVAKYPHFAGK